MRAAAACVQAGRKPLAHSDFVEGPLDLYGHEPEVDVMIEAKAKEQALLRYRTRCLTTSATVASTPAHCTAIS